MARIIKGECKLLRVFTDSKTRRRGLPLGEAIVEAARKAGLAGATLFEGHEGFRRGVELIDGRGSAWSFKSPKETLVEIVDEPSRIEAFAKDASELLAGTTLTVERAFVPELEEGS
jgi:hypothetical protein